MIVDNTTAIDGLIIYAVIVTGALIVIYRKIVHLSNKYEILKESYNELNIKYGRIHSQLLRIRLKKGQYVNR